MPPRIPLTGALRLRPSSRPISPATRALSSTSRRLADDDSSSSRANGASPFASSMTRGPPPPTPQQPASTSGTKSQSMGNRMLASLEMIQSRDAQLLESQKKARQRTGQSAALYAQEKERAARSTDRRVQTEELLTMMGLRLREGDVYSPQDLTPGEMRHYLGRKALGRGPPQSDLIEVTGVNPLDLYRNFTLIEHWRTTAGRIKHSRETGFKPKNQRKVARAVRRAVGLALVPSTRAHPERLSRDLMPVNEITARMQERLALGTVNWQS